MKTIFRFLIFLAPLLLNGCTGHSDRDGYKSIEGSADPANNGGKLSGDHFRKPHVEKSDSLKHRDSIERY